MVDSQPNTGGIRSGTSRSTRSSTTTRRRGTWTASRSWTSSDPRATCTLVTRYLIEHEVPVQPRSRPPSCTGSRRKVSGYPREATHVDDGALHFLFPLADKDTLPGSATPGSRTATSRCLLQALQSSFIYDRLIVSWVTNLPQPEQAAEVVDFMVRFEKVDWALCGGVCGDKLILSLRTSRHGVQAGDLLRQGGRDARQGRRARPAGRRVRDRPARPVGRGGRHPGRTHPPVPQGLRCETPRAATRPAREMLQSIQG